MNSFLFEHSNRKTTDTMSATTSATEPTPVPDMSTPAIPVKRTMEDFLEDSPPTNPISEKDDAVISDFTKTIIEQALAIAKGSHGRYTSDYVLKEAKAAIERHLEATNLKVEGPQPKKMKTKVNADQKTSSGKNSPLTPQAGN
jgi:hypothetical protein